MIMILLYPYLSTGLVESGFWTLVEVNPLHLVGLLVVPNKHQTHFNTYLVTTVIPLRASCSSAL